MYEPNANIIKAASPKATPSKVMKSTAPNSCILPEPKYAVMAKSGAIINGISRAGFNHHM
jgi:hypothetical protein